MILPDQVIRVFHGCFGVEGNEIGVSCVFKDFAAGGSGGQPDQPLCGALEFVPSPQVGRSRLLELGAGHCEIARMLRGRGWEVHAADIDAACVAEARLLGLPATRLDLNELLPFPARRIDFVVMLEVIEHVVRAEAALGQIT